MTSVIDTGDKKKLLLGERAAAGQSVQQEKSLNFLVMKTEATQSPGLQKRN